MTHEEFFDVVDVNDDVIGQASRSNVHRENLLHRATHLFVFNVQGMIFLQKRSKMKDCFPDCWDSSVSGHCEKGESYDVCIVREMKEEIGLHTPDPPTPILKVNACKETGYEFAWLYKILNEGPFTLQESEIEKGDWFTPDEVNRWIKRNPKDFAPSFILLWGKFWKKIQP